MKNTTKQPDDQAAAKLLPCPFCGYSASISEVESAGGNGRMIHIVGCNSEDCDVSFHGHARKVDAAKAWNTRQAAAEQRSEQPATEVREQIEAGLNVQNAEAKLWALLTGLECQNVDDFMARADTGSYLRFGKAYVERAKELIAQPKPAPAEPLGDVCENCGHKHGVGYGLYRCSERVMSQEHLAGPYTICDCKQFNPAPNPQAVEADVDLRTALAYEAGQRAERVRIAEELVSIRNSARNDAQEWLVNINELIEKLRGEQNAK